MHARSLLAASTTALAIICTYVPALGAECPVEVKSIVFNGQAASHSFVRYYLRLSGAAGTISSIRIALKTSNGRLESTTWQDATLKLVPNGKEKPGATGTFDSKTSDVIAAAIDQVIATDGDAAVVCDRAWVPIGGPDDRPNVFAILNDRQHTFDARVKEYEDAPHDIVDANFKSRVGPYYPAAAQNAGIQGDVTIRVTVGEDSALKKAVIKASSQDDDIDLAALDAARRSTYSAPLLDGKPIQRDYLVIYTFRLEGGPRRPTVEPSCALKVDSMVLDNAGQPDGPDWYHISFSAQRSDIIAAHVTLLNTAGAFVIEPWAAISLPPLGKEKTVQTTANIAWVGDEPLKAWVDSVTYADGRHDSCPTYYELVDRPDAAGALPRKYNPLTRVAGVVSRRVDPPAVATYPDYPPSALASDATGNVDIDALVNNAGAVVGAFIVSSSNNADIDAAALSAAMKNHYPPARNPQYFPTRVFHIEYDFEDMP